MSVRLVTAANWTGAKSAINTFLSNALVVHYSGAGVTVPAITLESAVSAISRSIAQGEQVDADEYSDADGLVFKYNLIRKYESARRRDASNNWHYGECITSVDVIGTRTADFVAAGLVDAITPPLVAELIEGLVGGLDILEMVVAGCALHQTSVLSVVAGAEYVEIDECHSNCHTSDYSSCDRGKR